MIQKGNKCWYAPPADAGQGANIQCCLRRDPKCFRLPGDIEALCERQDSRCTPELRANFSAVTGYGICWAGWAFAALSGPEDFCDALGRGGRVWNGWRTIGASDLADTPESVDGCILWPMRLPKQKGLSSETPWFCAPRHYDYVGTATALLGHWWEAEPIESFWEWLPDRFNAKKHTARVYLDAGANMGALTLQMLARKDVGQVIAFEPSPRNLYHLTASLLASGHGPPRALIYNQALGNKTGVQRCFALPGNADNTLVRAATPGMNEQAAMTPGARYVDVGRTHITRLDDLLPPLPSLYVHLLKIDVEGLDLEVLRGARVLLASGSVNGLRVEFTPSLERRMQVLELILGLGFQLVRYDYKTNEYFDVPSSDQQAYACEVAAYFPPGGEPIDLCARWTKQAILTAGEQLRCDV